MNGNVKSEKKWKEFSKANIQLEIFSIGLENLGDENF